MSKPINLLLVEDDLAVREALTKLLSGENYNVFTAATFEEAVAGQRENQLAYRWRPGADARTAKRFRQAAIRLRSVPRYLILPTSGGDQLTDFIRSVRRFTGVYGRMAVRADRPKIGNGDPNSRCCLVIFWFWEAVSCSETLVAAFGTAVWNRGDKGLRIAAPRKILVAGKPCLRQRLPPLDFQPRNVGPAGISEWRSSVGSLRAITGKSEGIEGAPTPRRLVEPHLNYV